MRNEIPERKTAFVFAWRRDRERMRMRRECSSKKEEGKN
jgi:hypothetical protein